MIYLARTLTSSVAGIFAGRRDKFQLAFLTFSASIISISELGIAKIFTEIVVKIDKANSFPYHLTTAFITLSVLARISHYFQRTKRVNILDRIIKRSNLKNSENSWNLSLAIEIANILGFLFQILIIQIFLVMLSKKFAALILLSSIMTILVFNYLAKKQEEFQIEVFRSRFNKKVVSSHSKIFERVRGGELGALVSGAIAIISLVLLIWIHQLNWISTSNAIVSFFAVRMLASNLNSLSSSLMRHARAKVNSSISTVNVTNNSPKHGNLEGWATREYSSPIES